MLEAAGFASPNALAVAIGSPDALRNFAGGKSRTLRADTLHALANQLGQPMDAVREALGIPSRAGAAEPSHGGYQAGDAESFARIPVRRTSTELPVRYAVQAGAWIEVDELTQARLKSPPVGPDAAYPADAQWLELVRGDSMDLFYPEGSWVHVVDAIAIGYVARHEDFVTIERKREQGGLVERSLKQIALKRGKIELWPRSRNPHWKAPLEVGAPIDEDDEVRIAALVIGGYLPTRR